MKAKFLALMRSMSGLTLIEILVGMGVLSILIAVAAPSMSDLLERRRVAATADEIAGILNFTKAETNSTNSLLFVHFDPDKSGAMSCAAVVTTSPTDGLCQCFLPPDDICPGSASKPLRLYQLPSNNVTFSAFATKWGGAANILRFSRNRMDVTTDGFHVDVVGKKKKYTLRVEVNTVGRVRICSPNNDMNG